MASIASIRTAIGTNLATISGLDVATSAPSQLNSPPVAVVMFEGFPEPRQAMAKGLTEMEFSVLVFVANSSQYSGGEAALDPYVATSGAGSVWVALESDSTLGGLAADLIVSEMSGYRWHEPPVGNLISCQWTLTVWADAS